MTLLIPKSLKGWPASAVRFSDRRLRVEAPPRQRYGQLDVRGTIDLSAYRLHDRDCQRGQNLGVVHEPVIP